MSDSFQYKTISKTGNSLYKVSGSKHIGQTHSVYSEEEIKAILAELWKQHHDATHICYAYRLGYKKDKFRVNDDGEPSGTAGKPIYGQILSYDLTNVLVTVIRYYGGTKLGTGGLIDAYKTAAQQAIEASEIINQSVRLHCKITFDYSLMPSVMKILKELNFEKVDAPFGDKAVIEFYLEASKQVRLEIFLEENQIELIILGMR
ncbi:MAG: IMPACT family protein [Flavobacteriales bacterium]